MSVRVAILGATGYGGGELLRLLLAHPEVDVAWATSRSQKGVPVGRVHRNLLGLTDLEFSAPSNADLIAGADVIIGALPHGASASVLSEFVDAGKRVIDLSGDFRLRSHEGYRASYKAEHPRPDLLASAIYGAPEAARDNIRSAKLVASPGCFATAMNLAALPAASLMTGMVTVTGMTGSSGSGADPSAGTHHPTRAQTLRPYKVLSHQHAGEVMQLWSEQGGRLQTLEFTPVSMPLVRGILVVLQADLAGRVQSQDQLERLYRDFYSSHPFVKVVSSREPECATVAGTNYAEVRARLSENGRLHVVCAIDNLVKGGAGQAVQSLNLMCGFEETAGLTWAGSWP
jgi:N-acetyl-gamma-glutamyl-phosphate reductase